VIEQQVAPIQLKWRKSVKMTIWRKYEPTLCELLADPGTRALMHADGVKRSEIEALLTRIRRTRVADADRKSFGMLAQCNQ
jgi:hypothetical protein